VVLSWTEVVPCLGVVVRGPKAEHKAETFIVKQMSIMIEVHYGLSKIRDFIFCLEAP
jgi:hypothetical protein